MSELPTGTVTFLFTDVEGSTKLLYSLGEEEFARVLAAEHAVIREELARHGGVEIESEGDALIAAFPTAPGALDAAATAQARLSIPVRMGIHTGTPLLAETGYVGLDLHRAARIAGAAHGGQVLVSAATQALVDSSNSLLLDLGEHRLKDLSTPERIYQLGHDGFPPLKTLYRTNLPIPATPFVGRERELAEVQELLERDPVRLLTLTGPGGTGKTRLAAQAAAVAADRFPDGVFWVSLAPLRDPELVLEQAAQTLDAKGDLAEHVGAKRILLLFDNFEHLMEAAAGVAELLGRCPNLSLLVTSRELLAVPGEHTYAVPPLTPEDANDLFLARARVANPGFEPDGVVGELCERLDNLPLALELAAARVRVLSAEQLLERLARRLDLLKGGRGVDARQQTLRAAIEWGHDLLDDEEQELFARLAVFAGGCTLEAAEQVCAADLDTLQSLVDKSFVRVRDDGRFWMLETIREFAGERLDATGEAEELRRRHAHHFLALAEECEPHVYESSDRLEREHDNFRAALDFFESEGETQLVLRLAGALGDFWIMQGYLAEGRRRLEAALAADDRPTLARAKALNDVSTMAVASGDPAAGRQWAEATLALSEELGDAWGIANSYWAIGYAVTEGGDAAAAQPLLEESLSRFRELGDDKSTVLVARNLAFSYHELGQLDRARALCEESVERARRIGFEQGEATVLGSLASVLADEGRVADAVAALTTAFGIDRRLGSRLELAISVARLARILTAAERFEHAGRLLSCSETLLAELGAGVPWTTRMNRETRARIRERLDGALLEELEADGAKLTADEAFSVGTAALSGDG